uniref:Uncharacterized protein n=1 Tax=Anguilla anguilla TaxID=7936 RepID=A0A0E9VYZ9_ANGAN
MITPTINEVNVILKDPFYI